MRLGGVYTSAFLITKTIPVTIQMKFLISIYISSSFSFFFLQFENYYDTHLSYSFTLPRVLPFYLPPPKIFNNFFFLFFLTIYSHTRCIRNGAFLKQYRTTNLGVISSSTVSNVVCECSRYHDAIMPTPLSGRRLLTEVRNIPTWVYR